MLGVVVLSGPSSRETGRTEEEDNPTLFDDTGFIDGGGVAQSGRCRTDSFFPHAAPAGMFHGALYCASCLRYMKEMRQ